MAIQETVTVEIVEVCVNDDYRVEVAQLKKVIDYSPQQARDFANELIHCAEAAEKALDDHLDERHARMTAAQPFTVDGQAVL